DGRLLSPQFSNALLINNLVAQNRQFYFGFDFVNNDPTSPQCQVNAGTNACYSLQPPAATPVYSEVAVVGDTAGQPLLASWQAANQWRNNVVSSSLQPFSSQYFNGPRDAIVLDPETSTKGLAVAAAFDEGGNFIDVRYGPLSLHQPGGIPWGNYHLTGTAGSLGQGLNLTLAGLLLGGTELLRDRDGTLRPLLGNWVVGAFQTTRAVNAPLKTQQVAGTE
ncbi:MAG: hypothetical protein JNJ89_07980, partial [Rubrivivax sp.]|nr:hypothetical protein [Rubrivivax sp.]